MIMKGIGTDLVSIARIEKLWAQFGDKFAKRILSAKELAQFEDKQDKVHFLAKRFAAKEAITKALGTGIGEQIGFHDMAILNYASGQPYVDFSPKTQAWLNSINVTDIQISISDEKEMAVAFCVVCCSQN